MFNNLNSKRLFLCTLFLIHLGLYLLGQEKVYTEIKKFDETGKIASYILEKSYTLEVESYLINDTPYISMTIPGKRIGRISFGLTEFPEPRISYMVQRHRSGAEGGTSPVKEKNSSEKKTWKLNGKIKDYRKIGFGLYPSRKIHENDLVSFFQDDLFIIPTKQQQISDQALNLYSQDDSISVQVEKFNAEGKIATYFVGDSYELKLESFIERDTPYIVFRTPGSNLSSIIFGNSKFPKPLITYIVANRNKRIKSPRRESTDSTVIWKLQSRISDYRKIAVTFYPKDKNGATIKDSLLLRDDVFDLRNTKRNSYKQEVVTSTNLAHKEAIKKIIQENFQFKKGLEYFLKNHFDTLNSTYNQNSNLWILPVKIFDKKVVDNIETYKRNLALTQKDLRHFKRSKKRFKKKVNKILRKNIKLEKKGLNTNLEKPKLEYVYNLYKHFTIDETFFDRLDLNFLLNSHKAISKYSKNQKIKNALSMRKLNEITALLQEELTYYEGYGLSTGVSSSYSLASINNKKGNSSFYRDNQSKKIKKRYLVATFAHQSTNRDSFVDDLTVKYVLKNMKDEKGFTHHKFNNKSSPAFTFMDSKLKHVWLEYPDNSAASNLYELRIRGNVEKDKMEQAILFKDDYEKSIYMSVFNLEPGTNRFVKAKLSKIERNNLFHKLKEILKEYQWHYFYIPPEFIPIKITKDGSKKIKG